ncbi:Cytochrome b561 [Rhodoplanes serenus]|uniref:Cytochrome b561 n=1 Tax=Rhodoplanes serenus TaxID=200615 RepID=A0A3S4DII0_9BRAD|nr:cytochrome b [Rhodoplanes serenus]MBI5112490.1 cytochrome b [Rhodovulum sp.]VCU11162.1 Cytochrome b561 [Rhodoplanes serenus]
MTRSRYDTFTQAIHWFTFIAVVGLFASGLIMEEMARGPAKSQLIGLHISFGVVIMALTAARLGWRLVTPQPDPIPGEPMVQLMAKAMHGTLYALLIAVPFLAMMMVWAKGRTVGVFGLFSVPPMIAPDRDLAEFLGDVHETAVYVLAALAGIHAVAAIVHHVVLKDGAIARMLPFGEPRQS